VAGAAAEACPEAGVVKTMTAIHANATEAPTDVRRIDT
jgi:hypothetical protein